MKSRTIFFSAVFAAALISTSANTEPANTMGEATQTKPDSSHQLNSTRGTSDNKRIEFSEFLKDHKIRLEEQFDQHDLNGDGILTRDELSTASINSAQKLFRKLDRNGDNVLSKEDRYKHHRGKSNKPRHNKGHKTDRRTKHHHDRSSHDKNREHIRER